MWRTCFVLSVFSIASLLGACAHSPPPDPPASAKPKSWLTDKISSKSTEELYAEFIAPGVFERSNSTLINGYTVESGNLLMPDKSMGSLVTVRSEDGSLTAVVGAPGKSGLLAINNKGESRFTPYPAQDYSLPDTLKGVNEVKSVADKSSATAGPHVIDMLVGYSRRAATEVGGDVHSNALAQVESVNLALRNSLVTNVSMKLIGVQIFEQEYPITPDTLYNLEQILSAGVSAFNPDMIYGVLAGHAGDTAVGYGYMPGRAAIGWVLGESFRHEVGHNAGGGHCPDGGAPVPYGYGFSNGRTWTAQCGNINPYYSTPAVRDSYGLLIGDAATADMARVWRENAQRLSSHTPTFDGERMILAGDGREITSTLTINRAPTPTGREAGVLAYSANEGPVRLTIGAGGIKWAALTTTLLDSSGVPHQVKLRGSRKVGTCQVYAMHNASACANGWDMQVIIKYLKSDNPGLPAGMYTGELKLYAVSLNWNWSRPIRVAISISGN